MFDLAVKWAVLAAVVAWLTRRSRHADAADAHRLWLLVLVAPLALLASSALLPPLAFVIPRVDLPSETAATAGSWLPTLYGVVVAVLLVRVVTGMWTVGRLVRRAQPVPSNDLQRLRAWAGAPALDVREADLRVPVTAGFVLPCVILPRGWRTLPDAALTAILRHEAAHVLRRDCAVSLLAAAIEAIFWIHPAAWVTSRRLRWFAEMACDARAANAMPSGSYAAELLALSAGWAGVPSPRYAITAGAETSIARRIRLLIERTNEESRRTPLLAVALLVLSFGVPASAVLRFSTTRAVAPSTPFEHGGGHTHPAHAGVGMGH